MENRKQISKLSEENESSNETKQNQQTLTQETNDINEPDADLMKEFRHEIKNFYKIIQPNVKWSEKKMEQKIIFLEESLNNKKEVILEKEIVIEELNRQIKQIEEEVSQNKETNLKSAMKFNEVKTKFRDIMRKMMAVVSEVSVYQTNVVNLQRVRQEKSSQLKSIEKQMCIIYKQKVGENVGELASHLSGKVI